jgi:hypothetical protein
MVQRVTKKLTMKRQPEARHRPANAFPAGDPNSKQKKYQKILYFCKIIHKPELQNLEGGNRDKPQQQNN